MTSINQPLIKFTDQKTYEALSPFLHPRRPRGSQSGREKRWDESFQVRAKEPLGTDSHQTTLDEKNGFA